MQGQDGRDFSCIELISPRGRPMKRRTFN
jgi:hypothetical protein